MDTQKLFDLDGYLREFTAQVLSCRAAGGSWEVVLDRTAFYPEGGGQPWDTGTLGDAAVTQVHARGGEIVHTCSGPLEPGATVAGAIDWARRFDLMQQHSGEHIVSGLIHAAYGCDNVGFHMGQDAITIDFNALLEDAQLQEIEQQANEIVWQDRELRIFYPGTDALAALPYRSKKELHGAVRLVEIPGADLCACCGTHVRRTGEIGLIRLLSCVHFRGGVRIEMLCGGRALEHAKAVWAQNRRISNLLSAKPLETAAAAERACAELAQANYRVTQLENRLFSRIAAALAGAGDVALLEPGLDADGVRRLSIAAAEACGGRAAVFSPGESGCKYALCHPGGDLRQFCQALNQQLDGRGGGKPNFMQGSLRSGEEAVRAFLGAQAPAFRIIRAADI